MSHDARLMSDVAGWRNEKVLREFDPPLAVEHLVYEVRAEAYERWKAAEFEMWTKGEADRFPFFVGKETWLAKGEIYRVTIVIYWSSIEAWSSIDPEWLEAQEQAFAEMVGPDTVRLVYAGHEGGDQYFKVSEYR